MATYRFAKAEASVSVWNWHPTQQPGEFCLVSENTGVNVTLGGGAVTALIETLDGRWRQSLTAGYHVLPQPGWYMLQVGEFNAYNDTETPSVIVTYQERFRDDDVDLEGASFPSLEYASTPIQRGKIELATLNDRVLFQVDHLDNLLCATLDGDSLCLNLTFHQEGIYELTQRIPNGSHALTLIALDKNRENPWHFRYRLGDATAWKYADHCSNGNCSLLISRREKPVYTITFHFVMRT